MAKHSYTEFVFIDNSAIPEIPVDVTNAPLFLIATGSDTGREKLNRIKGNDFYKEYGTPSYEKYGIASLFADRIIQRGGELLIKRIVADDATLSNAVVCVETEQAQVQKRNADGELLYQKSGEPSVETTDSGGGNTPIMINVAKLKWVAKNVTGAKNTKDIESKAAELKTGNTYPVFWLSDLGRNADHLRFNLSIDHSVTKRFGEAFYTLRIMNSGVIIDEAFISFNPNPKTYGESILKIGYNTLQHSNIGFMEESFNELIQSIATHSGIDKEQIVLQDLLNGKSFRGNGFSGIVLHDDSNKMNDVVGIPFGGGSDGSEFGTDKYNHTKYKEKLRNFFGGKTDPEIYDLEQHRIFACMDADYPDEVKDDITELVNFRQDFMFFRDCGMRNTTQGLILNQANKYTKTKFAADYSTTYDVAVNNKLTNMPILYDIIDILIYNYNVSLAFPLAGEANRAVAKSAIEGTINFLPIVTPTVNQKDIFDDYRINYATYTDYKSNLTLQKQYTSQEAHTQLSYVNNMLLIQAVMRAIRGAVPKHRFTLQEGNDFSQYSEVINRIISNFRGFFYKLEFKYVANEIMQLNKIFTGQIEFQYNGWPEAERITLYPENPTA